ncbi:MAG: hypothetical protein HZB51_30205 [Chloroflexi bacterium]|nr:hypothetical protein [Chloroflexota bacterium]
MFKRESFVLTLLLLSVLSVHPTALAQSGSTNAFSAPLDAYLTARGDHATKSYVTNIAASPANAWNAGVTTFRSAPQQVGPIVLGVGQTTLPGIGSVTPTGSCKQDLVIPNGVPVLGNWNTGIQTTVNTCVGLSQYLGASGRRCSRCADDLGIRSPASALFRSGRVGFLCLLADLRYCSLQSSSVEQGFSGFADRVVARTAFGQVGVLMFLMRLLSIDSPWRALVFPIIFTLLGSILLACGPLGRESEWNQRAKHRAPSLCREKWGRTSHGSPRGY